MVYFCETILWFQGHFLVRSDTEVKEWMASVTFDNPVKNLEVFEGTDLKCSVDKTTCTFKDL